MVYCLVHHLVLRGGCQTVPHAVPPILRVKSDFADVAGKRVDRVPMADSWSHPIPCSTVAVK